MTGRTLRVLPLPVLPGGSPSSEGRLGRLERRWGLPLAERNARAYRHLWVLLISGALEPLFYLLSVRVGLGALVGQIAGPDGRPVTYTVFVTPALLATSAMNGAVQDCTFNVFHKLKYAKVYDAALVTPLGPRQIAVGETIWSLAATTFMRSWKDFDFVILATLPMFLFSTTFYPLSVYPRARQIVVECTPLSQAVTLLRGFALGVVGPAMLVSVAYLTAMGLAGLYLAGRCIRRLLLA